ncbi:MAG: GntR family transcriptional regulator [Clostridiaceae bacterium]|nr:GntR family transcriptional regulator [Clostridiaceae bacterium]
MIDFSKLKFNNKEPIYQQIVDFVKREIIKKNAVDGDELPSRRELAFILDINPNTVQKAYKQMEDEGFIKTGNNVRSVIQINDEIYAKIENELTVSLVQDFIQSAKESALSYERVITLLSRMWDEDKV